MIAYRMQDAERNITDLLDPEQQFSFPMGGEDEDVRHGVSGCESLPALAAYIACYAIEADTPVIIRIEGAESEDAPVDAEAGEVLLLPTSAERIDTAEEERFFDLVSDLVDAHWEQGLTLDDLVEMAEQAW